MPATVIVDVSSIAHALAGSSRDRSDVRLESIHQVLCDHGYDPKRFWVALSIEAVTTGPESNLGRARHLVDRNHDWLERETLDFPVPVFVAPGAHNGSHEIGVDDMVVATALVESARIANDPQRRDETIVILTHDSDMDHLAELVAPTPLVVAGRFDDAAQKRLRRAGVPFLALSRNQFQRCGDRPRRNWKKRSIDAPVVQPADVTRVDSLPLARTTAIVDAYGLACTAATVLGLSRLPTAGSIRHLLAMHGETAEESALLVTIPDVFVGSSSDGADGRRRLNAWKERRFQLNRLARKLETDGDPRTIERRAILRPSRIPAELADRLDRRGAVRAAKRLSTQLTADLVRSLLEESSPSVIVMTDSPHVAWVQSSLPALLGDSWADVRVMRWGALAAPLMVYPDGETAQLPDADFMVITERRLAELVCLGSRGGPESHRALLDVAGRSQFDGAMWKVVGYDPEVDGVTVRNSEHPEQELTLAGGIALGLEVGATLDGLGAGVELRFDPTAPASMPVLATRNAPHGTAAARYEVAEILDRSGTLIRFDIDGDGRADVEIDVVHDLRPVRPEAAATLGRLQVATAGSHQWVYVSSTNGMTHRYPETVDVISVDEVNGAVAGLPSDGRTHGPLLPPPGSPSVQLDTGDTVWAINVAADGGEASWITLSTPLRRTEDDDDGSMPGYGQDGDGVRDDVG